MILSLVIAKNASRTAEAGCASKPVVVPEEPEKKRGVCNRGILKARCDSATGKTPPKEEMHSPYFEPEEETPEMERLLYPSGSYPSSLRSRLRRNSGKE